MFRPAVLLAALAVCGCANIPADNPPEMPANAGSSVELAGAPAARREAAPAVVPFEQPTPTQRPAPASAPGAAAPAAAQPDIPPDARPTLVGGYSPANESDPELMAAEKVAIGEIYRREPQRGMVEDIQREAQVVAGMNYRFTVKMSGQNSYRVVIFRPLEGAMMVTSFEKLSGG
jgi:hypothetical protein